MRAKLLLSAVATLAAFTPALADEGMWTFDNFPSADGAAKYGVTIDQAWLDRVRAGAVRLSAGCSASLVSAEGLVLTNHHCVRDCVQELSTADARLHQGRLHRRRARARERLCPGMQAEILTAIADVTADVNAATGGKTGQDFVSARDARDRRIWKRRAAPAAKPSPLPGDHALSGRPVQALHLPQIFRRAAGVRAGSADGVLRRRSRQFQLPALRPRFLLRASLRERPPVATPHHLQMERDARRRTASRSSSPAIRAAPQRLLTAAQLETMRDVVLPARCCQFSEMRGRLTPLRRGKRRARPHRQPTSLFGIENSFKALRGQRKALLDPALIDAKRKADAELQAKVAADPRLAAEIGDPWGEIAQAQIARAEAVHRLHVPGSARGLRLAAVRLCARGWCAPPRSAPSRTASACREYTDAGCRCWKRACSIAQPVYPEVEQLMLEFWLTKLREYLTADAAGTQLYLGQGLARDPGRARWRSRELGRCRRAQAAVGRRHGAPSRRRTIR